MSFNNNSYKPLWSTPSVIKPKEEKVKGGGSGSKLKERAKLRKEAKMFKECKPVNEQVQVEKLQSEFESLNISNTNKSDKDVREPNIVAVSQSSRFHTETLVTLAKEIDLRQVTISVDDKELLSDTKLLIKAGTRYGLIGRNGVGKTTLFKVLAENTLIGLPTNLRILSIQQLANSDESKTVLDAVLEADLEAVRTVKEAEAFNRVLNLNTDKSLNLNPQDTEKMVRVVGELLNQRDYNDMEKARRIAIHRSGKRGLEARTVALELEHKYKQSTELLLPENKEKLAESITSDTINNLLSEVFEKLALVDMDQAKAKATTILLGLGFKSEQLNTSVLQLSGGWRMRVALAKALFYAPDLLLMDEPTNHLDLKAIKWLTRYLIEEFPVESSVVVISHDRHFLNEVSQEIISFKDNKLTYHPGNYDMFEQASYDLRLKKERMQASIDRRTKHYQASIDKAVKFARSSGDDKRLGMVASRKKRLEKMGMMKTDDGKRFKQSNRPGFHLHYKQQVELEKKEIPITLPIPDPDPLRSNGSLIHLDAVTYRYPNKSKDTLAQVHLTIYPHDRIALVGDNGSGKSTLMKLLVGELQPTSGKMEVNPHFHFAFFGQHSIDQLDTLDRNASAVSQLLHNHPGLTEAEARQWLGAYQLSNNLATNPLHTLSGGQKVRFVLADLLLEGPHLLLLDEVTNHLDLMSVEALAVSLNEFEGAVVLISHDRWFLNTVGTTNYRTQKGSLKQVKGKE